MKYLTLFLLFSSLYISAQTRFNHQYDLPYQFKTFTSVLPTDSCYYVTGIISDTTDGTYKLGNIFLKIDLEGIIETEKTLISDAAWIETWRGDLISDGDGHFLDVGDMRDTVRKVLLARYNGSGDTIETKTYFNPVFPSEDFIVAAALERTEDGELYLLCGIDSAPDGPDADITLLHLDGEGNLLGSHTFGNQNVTEIPYSLVLDVDGGAIIGANKSNSAYVSQNYYSRAHIFKVDESGEVVWEYESPSNQLTDIARDMLLTDDGGVVVASGKGD